MAEPLYEIVYVSESRLPKEALAHQQELDRILRRAQSRNERDRITGALVVGRNHFAQVLEGPLDVLKQTFGRIETDPRHGNVVVIRMEPIAVRNWPNWSMALHRKDMASSSQSAISDLPSGERASLQQLEEILVSREAGRV